MPRPPEYDNLIKTRALEPVQPTPGAVAGFLKAAEGFMVLAKTKIRPLEIASHP